MYVRRTHARPSVRVPPDPRWGPVFLLAAALLAAVACQRSAPPAAAPKPPPPELVVYDWAEGGFKSVADDFAREYGVKLHHELFRSQEEAVAGLRAGKVCDVAIIESQFVRPLAEARLLAEIDYRSVPNFKNVFANFRDLSADPGNRYSVPCSFGTTGLLLRRDLAKLPVTRWADLWSPRLAGKVAVRSQMRELIGLTLLALGHSPNSEDPKHLQAVLGKLLQLKKTAVIADEEPEKAVPLITSGKVMVMEGFPEDYRLARQDSHSLEYVFPAEGVLLWSDNFVIPAAARNRPMAEAFINFMLRPEISARDANGESYAVANEAAHPLLKPEIRDDPSSYPPSDVLRRAHSFIALTPQGEKLYREVWSRFLDESR
ncbi:MAG: spermidine/putrescine ABC transporter substrate-binding protein [Deltaproteobacteria bacterium]|nr:spermidine/putrescine ABC transporter substrate-binding protein [Deltaproteobacteria bacterium]